MIKKFNTIGNLAVFQNFDWDKSVLDKDSNILEFKQINILYGRNYSGKTTLSRILRAIEIGKISDKFEKPAFCVAFSDNSEINQDYLTGHGKKVRVFNDDFVRDNLKFIINPDENIEPFAILGIDNLRIEGEIKAIESEIGIKEEGKETGLNAQLKVENGNLLLAQDNYNSRKGQLDVQLNTKATDRNIGIKYKPEKFGDQNYTIRKLETDIEKVLDVGFKPITSAEKDAFEKLIEEKVNIPIPTLQNVSLRISDLNISSQLLITQEVSNSDKIQELLKDAIINRWVKEGRQLHKDKISKCAFCNNAIEKERWNELERHFDEKSEKLELSISQRIQEIENKITLVQSTFNTKINFFYSKFHNEFNRLSNLFASASGKYISELNKLKKQLQERKDDLLNPKTFIKAIDYSKRIGWIFEIYENLRIKSNNFSSSLLTEQSIAREKLRLKEVSDFATTINYSVEVIAINELKENTEEANKTRDKVANEIFEKSELIESKRRELKDESKGADKVNEYLNNFFGHGFLSLQAVEFFTTDATPVKKFRFEIMRNDKKAYHLSEGESSLVAFCYFMAKMDDIETKGVKPIIWIDDPISSLDSNHIFFIYSLINSEIVHKSLHEQLFISTHNLDFLKYLKRLSGANNESKKSEVKKVYQYFIINRIDKVSEIKIMPNYLRDYVTEFNYLFQQIYQCSTIDSIDDSNYTIFYNFGNNARKFLEIFLYYKYPDNTSESDKLIKFFGDNKVPSVLIDRINNEYSHLCGVFERGATPTEVPEMKKTAQFILDKIKLDTDQYNSLLKSIGITTLIP